MKNWNEAKSASTDEILAWAETQPWAKAMAECPQDAEWHVEGDVWTHTRMVVAEVECLPEFRPSSQTMRPQTCVLLP